MIHMQKGRGSRGCRDQQQNGSCVIMHVQVEGLFSLYIVMHMQPSWIFVNYLEETHVRICTISPSSFLYFSLDAYSR